jgi:signal transduction histidine kinase
MGMTRETMDKLLRQFYKAEQGVSGKKIGTGLGLSICWRIVDAYSGKIRVESPTGKGSVFRFKLPHL